MIFLDKTPKTNKKLKNKTKQNPTGRESKLLAVSSLQYVEMSRNEDGIFPLFDIPLLTRLAIQQHHNLASC